MGQLRIMNHTGDETLTWEAVGSPEAKLAKEAFDRALKQPRAAFKIEGEDSEQVTKFDPDPKNVYVLVPQIVGG